MAAAIDILCGRRRRNTAERGKEEEIQFPVESAVTAQGITTQMIRIMKTGACFLSRECQAVTVHIQNVAYLRRDIAGDSEPKGPFFRLRGRSV